MRKTIQFIRFSPPFVLSPTTCYKFFILFAVSRWKTYDGGIFLIPNCTFAFKWFWLRCRRPTTTRSTSYFLFLAEICIFHSLALGSLKKRTQWRIFIDKTICELRSSISPFNWNKWVDLCNRFSWLFMTTTQWRMMINRSISSSKCRRSSEDHLAFWFVGAVWFNYRLGIRR